MAKRNKISAAKPLSSDYSYNIRKQAILALFSDNVLSGQLVLKGGNALRIVHAVSSRTSKDIDFSVKDDFVDIDEVRVRIERCLSMHFCEHGFAVFDVRLDHRPKASETKWGGYELVFKVVDLVDFRPDDLARMRILASGHDRCVEIDISKDEYIGSLDLVEFENYTIQVATLEAIGLEKLRALCQQMSEYTLRKHKTARARDFYDISLLQSQKKVDFLSLESIRIAHEIFQAKCVPADLLLKLGEESTRDFHRDDWPAVISALPRDSQLLKFDDYHAQVAALANDLHARWDV